jgi:hypothetical protein
MQNRDHSKRRVIRYSLAMVLFIITCLCGYLGGYHAGYKAGDDEWSYGRAYAITYNVADLVAPTPDFVPAHQGAPDFDNLVAAVTDAVGDQLEEQFAIRPFPQNLSLVVSGSGIVHRRVNRLLSDLRKNTPRVKEEMEERLTAVR